MSQKNHFVIFPGLGNNIGGLKWLSKNWEKYGFVPHVFETKWQIEEKGFQSKLQRALKLIDSLSAGNSKIFLLGNSAGSSFAINVYVRRRDIIDGVIINCGRVRDGNWPWFTFDQAVVSSLSFKESVLKSQEALKTLTIKDKKKILTLRPLFDEIVPPETVYIQGAQNIVTPSVEHVIGIILNLTLFRKRIFNFINQD